MANIITYRDITEANQAIANDRVCRKIGEHITKKYPDRKWMIEVVDKGRVCKIRLPQISMDYGMQFRIMDIMDFNLKKAERMAGEMLERFNLTRGRTDNTDMMALKRDIRGSVIGAKAGDVSANVIKRSRPLMLLGANGRLIGDVQ